MVQHDILKMDTSVPRFKITSMSTENSPEIEALPGTNKLYAKTYNYHPHQS